MYAESTAPEVQNHVIRQYYIRCAEHALKFAPLPEFKDAIAVIRWYDDSPDEEKHEMLVEIYDTLRSHNYLYDRDAEYTAIAQFYQGLLKILENAIDGLGEASSSDTFNFTEAVFCGVNIARGDGSLAQHNEIEYQHALWREIFPN
jgi:hypothetical protein